MAGLISCGPGGGDHFWWKPRTYRVIDGCWVYLPKSFDEQKQYPAIVFLQGGDAAAAPNNRAVKDAGPAAVALEQGEDLLHQWASDSFLIINPHMTVGPRNKRQWYHHSAELIKLVDAVATEYPIDRSRIYLTGASRGGHGSFGVVKDGPQFFAATIPIAGRINCKEGCEALSEQPLWIVHREGDHVVLVDRAREVVAYFEGQMGLPFHETTLDMSPEAMTKTRLLTILPGEGHNGWYEVYHSRHFYEWIAQFRNGD